MFSFVKGLILVGAMSISCGSFAQTPSDVATTEDLAEVKAEVAKTVSTMKTMFGSLQATNCDWSNWKQRYELHTSYSCDGSRFLKSIEFRHAEHQNLSPEESVRILCCDLRVVLPQ